VDEPFIKRALRTKCVKKITDLGLDGAMIPLTDACGNATGKSFFGVPDPTGTLAAGEIYVRDTGRAENNTLGDVLVVRQPAYHLGDPRKMKAVAATPELEEHFRGHAFAVVFSTRGERPAAHELSEGDYDGDTFAVIWDPEIVGAFRQSEPRPLVKKAEKPAQAPDAAGLDDRAAWVEYFMAARKDWGMQAAANAWKVLCDKHGPEHAECLEAGRAWSDGIDQPKHGRAGGGGSGGDAKRWAALSKPRPHWWDTTKGTGGDARLKTYTSTSLAGKVGSRMAVCHGSASFAFKRSLTLTCVFKVHDLARELAKECEGSGSGECQLTLDRHLEQCRQRYEADVERALPEWRQHLQTWRRCVCWPDSQRAGMTDVC
jgi:hypothetical protein